MALAVIFDLDGTLLDTLEDLADSANEALEACGFASHAVEAYRLFVGEGMAVLMERILPVESRGREEIARLLAVYREAYGRRWAAKSRPYEGIEGMLRGLAARGVALAVLSNKPQANTEVCVGHFLGEHPFVAVFGQREEVPRKPDPAGALEIALALGLDPREILFVGDTATDMDTARAAGMVAVGVLWGFRSEEELRRHGATHVVARPEEILDLC